MLAEKMMTVQEARAVLQDTSRLSPEQVEEAEKVIRGFYGQKPRSFCVACSCGIWSEHRTAAGHSVWACSNCHRPPMSNSEWLAQQAPTLAKAGKQAAAIRQLATAELEQLITEAIEARAAYVETIAALGWLIRKGHGDKRSAQLVAEADTPPVRWPEAAAAAASGGRLARKIAALERAE